MLNIEVMREHVQQKLTPNRYNHSLCVQRQSAKLAKIHGVDWYKAAVAGLLHDVMRDCPAHEQLKYIRFHGIMLDNLTLQNPTLWHSIAGSLYISKHMGVSDSDIINAVRYHTTGRAGMSKLEKVLFLADATSSDRKYANVEQIRILSENSLDKAMLEVQLFNVKEVARMGKPLVKDTKQSVLSLIKI